MDALEAVIRVLIEQGIRGVDPFDLDYSDLSEIHNTVKTLNVPAIIGNSIPFSSDNDSEIIKSRKTVKSGSVEEMTENLYWSIVKERRDNDPYKYQKRLYKDYLRAYDAGEYAKCFELENRFDTEPEMIDFFENSGCTDLTPEIIEPKEVRQQ